MPSIDPCGHGCHGRPGTIIKGNNGRWVLWPPKTCPAAAARGLACVLRQTSRLVVLTSPTLEHHPLMRRTFSHYTLAPM
jgi:hypothetical protein